MFIITRPKLIPRIMNRTYNMGDGVVNGKLAPKAAVIMAKPINIVIFLPILLASMLASGNAAIAATCARISGMIASFCLKPSMYCAYVVKLEASALYAI